MLKHLFGALAALSLMSVAAWAQNLAPAERFIDPVSTWGATISPDGNYVAYIARTDTEQRVVVVDLQQQSAHAIQSVSGEFTDINYVAWKGSDRLVSIVTFRQHVPGAAHTGTSIRAGGGDYFIRRVIAMNRDGSHVLQMFEGQTSQLAYGFGSTSLLDSMPSDPTHVLIVARDRNGLGIYIGDVTNGSTQKLEDGEDLTTSYETDINGAAVMRTDYIRDGSGYRIYRRAPGAREWTFVTEVRRGESLSNTHDFEIYSTGPSPGQIYVMARPDNADLSSLYLYNTATGELGQPIAGDATEGVYPWLSRRTHEIVATCVYAPRRTCQARDPAMQRHLNALDAFFQRHATITLVDMSDDGGKWLVYVNGPTNPGGYYLYEVAARRVSPIAALYPNLDESALAPTEVVNYQARDGAQLWAYVTAREGVAGPRPMIVMPHGGPEARDYYDYDAFTAFLASRGYVVVQPNFRGGSGFGRAFADAGRGQWGLRMQDDVTDAVRHMIEAGVADPHRICIVGYSYGGYAALEGVSSTPDLYKCAISIAGPADLQLMLNRQGAHWGYDYQYWLRSIGTDSASIAEHSPRLHADRITAPVLLIHGVDDETVLLRQSELMQEALNSTGHPTRLIRVPDENHYWDTWSNEHRLMVFQEMDQFLAQNLGPGR